MRAALILLPVLALVACGRSSDEPSSDEGATVTIDADNGQVRAAADGRTGAVKIDLPGFKGELKLPKVRLDADDFALNGVHLYPGSTIDAVDINGVGQEGGLRVRFSSPATPATVRDWFHDRLRNAGFDIRTEGDALVGRDQEKKPFRMELAPANGDRAQGTITIGG